MREQKALVLSVNSFRFLNFHHVQRSSAYYACSANYSVVTDFL